MSEYKFDWTIESHKKYNTYTSFNGDVYYLVASDVTGEYSCRKLPNPTPYFDPDGNPTGVVWVFNGTTSESDVRKEVEKLFTKHVEGVKVEEVKAPVSHAHIPALEEMCGYDPTKPIDDVKDPVEPVEIEEIEDAKAFVEDLETVVVTATEPLVETEDVETTTSTVLVTEPPVPTITVVDDLCTITAENAIKCKYTTDGKDVRTTSRIFRNPFTVTEGMIIKAIACYENGISEQAEYIC